MDDDYRKRRLSATTTNVNIVERVKHLIEASRQISKEKIPTKKVCSMDISIVDKHKTDFEQLQYFCIGYYNEGNEFLRQNSDWK